MNSLPTLDLPEGKVGFAASVLSWSEEPRFAFRLELAKRPTTYGEWRPQFAKNDNDFDVEIVSAGYLNKHNLGSPYPAHRLDFSVAEQDIARNLIKALFADPSIRAGVSPFSSKKTRFLGVVNFASDWMPKREG